MVVYVERVLVKNNLSCLQLSVVKPVDLKYMLYYAVIICRVLIKERAHKATILSTGRNHAVTFDCGYHVHDQLFYPCR